MARRIEPPDALDYFPTPPWATRALFRHVVPRAEGNSVWEPAAGEGHMAEVLREYMQPVIASDVHDYGRGYLVGSFVGVGLDVMPAQTVDWVITNPPFTLAIEFAERALEVATIGVALLVRSVWAETVDRYERLFAKRPPAIIAQFVERCSMIKGRWNPKANTATAYSWFIWDCRVPGADTRFVWIPPGCKKRLTKQDDAARFAI
jgi:hypothetical protein